MAQKVMVNGLDIGYVPPANASDVTYSSTVSGLAATNVSNAIDAIMSLLATVVEGTILAGETSVTLQSSAITTSSGIDVYFEDALMAPSAVTVATGSCTVEIDTAREADLGVAVRVINIF